MAKINHIDGRKVRGKMNKKSKEVHRVRNGREHVYTIENEYEGKPSASQKLQRSIFGKTNAIVNGIMADPIQVQEWQARMDEYNRTRDLSLRPMPKRYTTVRSFVFAVISEQIKHKPAAKRRKANLPFSLPRDIKLQIKPFSELSAAEIYEILKARFDVFVCQQHIIYLDEDNIDYLATHFSLRKNGLVIAYARLFPDAEKQVLRIGRMLTLERGKGFAKYLMAQIEEFARKQGVHTLRLHAQTQAAGFYEHLGFTTKGDIFIEAEIPHILMEKSLD